MLSRPSSPKLTLCLAKTNYYASKSSSCRSSVTVSKHTFRIISFTLLAQFITPVKASLSVAEAAKIFAQHGIKIGQNRLFKLLRDLKLIAKRKGRQWKQPTQKSIEQGLCVIVVPIGSKGTPYITMKGMHVLAQEQFSLLALMSRAEALHG